MLTESTDFPPAGSILRRNTSRLAGNDGQNQGYPYEVQVKTAFSRRTVLADPKRHTADKVFTSTRQCSPEEAAGSKAGL
jgi:hypothetical protein